VLSSTGPRAFSDPSGVSFIPISRAETLALLEEVKRVKDVYDKQGLLYQELIRVQGGRTEELMKANEMLYATVKAQIVCQAGDQTTIAQLRNTMSDATADDDEMSVLELVELRRWKREFCADTTRGVVERLELALHNEQMLKAENALLRSLSTGAQS
jgi:hypothetical protein